MTELKPQPSSSDAILGGQTPPPVTGAILGGLAGAKQRMESQTIAARLAALSEALQYGEQGIELGLEALQDPSPQVQQLACRLLRQHEQGAQALLDHQPLSYFTTLANWRQEIYNPQTGITDPINNAYVVRMTNTGRERSGYNLSQFKSLLKDPRLSELQALVFQIDYNYWDKDHTFGVALEEICEAQEQFPNLKALFVGDSEGDRSYEYRKSKVKVFDIRPLLEAFPNLEVLQVFGHFGEYDLECQGLRHETLKTLIVETADLNDANIEQLCEMDLPALEYFELWYGRYHRYRGGDRRTSELTSILAGLSYPKLKYLGLCSNENANFLLKEVLASPIEEQLIVLNLERGTLNDIQPLLDHDGLPNLRLLNVSGNNLDDSAIARLNDLPFDILAENQDDPCEGERHNALYE